MIGSALHLRITKCSCTYWSKEHRIGESCTSNSYCSWYCSWGSCCKNAGVVYHTLLQILFFLGSKITADGDCIYEIKRCLLFGRKAMTNPDRVLKSKDITLPTKVHIVKAMVFTVVIYEYESWSTKKAEHRRTDTLNCGAGEDSWESLGLQGDPTSPS